MFDLTHAQALNTLVDAECSLYILFQVWDDRLSTDYLRKVTSEMINKA